VEHTFTFQLAVLCDHCVFTPALATKVGEPWSKPH